MTPRSRCHGVPVDIGTNRCNPRKMLTSVRDRRVPVALALASVGIGGLTAVPARAATTPAVHLTFDQAASSSQLRNAGSASVAVTVASRSGGSVDKVPGSSWQGQVGRTPAFDARSSAPRGVIKVTSTSGDPLSPLTSPFRFGADVRLDAGTTASHASGSGDNGDNVVQRGRFGDRAQYKIQVDSRRPSCRVKGSSGAVMVTSPISLAAGTWYRLECQRSGSVVTLTVQQYSSSGSVVATTTTTARGATGSVRAPKASQPLSVGGKLNNKGGVASDSDQFNGLVDNVVLSIG